MDRTLNLPLAANVVLSGAVGEQVSVTKLSGSEAFPFNTLTMVPGARFKGDGNDCSYQIDVNVPASILTLVRQTSEGERGEWSAGPDAVRHSPDNSGKLYEHISADMRSQTAVVNGEDSALHIEMSFDLSQPPEGEPRITPL